MLDMNRISEITERLDFIDDVFNRPWLFDTYPTDNTGFLIDLFNESQFLFETVVHQEFGWFTDKEPVIEIDDSDDLPF